jgi:hypothetical protein
MDEAAQLLQAVSMVKQFTDKVGTHPVRSWSDLLPKVSWKGKKSSYVLPKGKPNTTNNSKKTSTMVSVDGRSTKTATFTKKRKRKRGKKKKQSTREIVKRLKRNLPKMSKKHKLDYQCLVMPTAKNNRTVFELPMVNGSTVEQLIDGLTAVDSTSTVDYTASNTSVKINWFYKLMCKNNGTSNAKIRFAFFKCVEDDNESILDNVIEGLGDRGYTGLPSVSAPQAATATESYYPRRCAFGATTPYHTPLFGIYETKRKWKQLGKVQEATIGPGATFDVIKSGAYTYKPEVLDNEVFTFHKNFDYSVIIEISGDLAHDDTNTRLIGRAGAQIDCEEYRKITAMYANPKGLDEVEYTDTLTDTNFTTPNFADTVASAIQAFTV